MAWESTGTVTVTNGSRTVTGAGAGLHWINAKINPADALIISGQSPMEIESVDSATQITLRKPWLGATAGGVAYVIQPTRGFGADLASSFRAIEATQKGYVDTVFQGRFASGTVAQPGMRFVGDDDTGLVNLGPNAIGVATGGVERMRVEAQAVTIGRGLERQTLALNGTAATGDGAFMSFNRNSSPTFFFGHAGAALGGQETDDQVYWTYATQSHRFYSNGSERFRIDGANGNVTIQSAYSSPLSAGLRIKSSIPGVSWEALGSDPAMRSFSAMANYSAPGIWQINRSDAPAGAPLFRMFMLDGTNGNAFACPDSGSFGVGTTDVSCRLTVSQYADDISSGEGSYAVALRHGSGTRMTLGYDPTGAHIQSYGSKPLVLNKLGNDVSIPTGILLVGVTSASTHTIYKGGAPGTPILDIAAAATLHIGDSFGTNGAATVLRVTGLQGSGRSISAAGTINANGADMAEYKRKAAGCGTIAKGDLCGVTAGNELTKTWGQSIDFVIKSWRPHTVGGDTWGHADSVTPDGERIGDKPVEPAEPDVPDLEEIAPLPTFDQMDPGTFDEAEPAFFDEPMPAIPDAPALFDQPLPGVDASDEDVALWAERDSADRVARYRFLAAMQPVGQWQQRKADADAARQAWIERGAAHDAAVLAYAQARAAYDAAVAEREQQVETRAQTIADAEAAHDQWTVDHAQYLVDLAAWEARHEAARANVDRIAIAGQVPVNVDGDFAPGDFIVAMPSGSGIKAVAYSPADFVALDPVVQLRKVARVWGVTERFVETIDGEEREVWPAGLAWCAVSVG